MPAFGSHLSLSLLLLHIQKLDKKRQLDDFFFLRNRKAIAAAVICKNRKSQVI